jgi:Gas vesicle protein
MNDPRSAHLVTPGSTTVERGTSNLADVLERVLDKGIVIAGDIKINLLEVELLTIKLRLLVASVDRAKEMGIDWWEHDRALSSGDTPELEERLARIEAALGVGSEEDRAPEQVPDDGRRSG